MIRILNISGGQSQATRLPSWAVALGAVLAVALGLAVLVLGIGLLLVLAPLAIAGALVARWRLKKMLAEAQARYAERQQADGIIDAEYRVIDGEPRR